MPESPFLNFGLPTDYKSRNSPLFDDHEQLAIQGKVWQKEVYDLCRVIGLGCKAKRIIDIGCGYAEKLVPFKKDFEIIGLDTSNNISWCNSHYDFGSWITCDLEKVDSIDKLKDSWVKGSIVICADVIEHLVNPLLLLKTLYQWQSLYSFLVLSTPDRELCRGKDHLGPPPNQNHVREWSISEFKNFLEAEGFHPSFIGLTHPNSESVAMTTIIAIIPGVNS